jgi:hypothetical protein
VSDLLKRGVVRESNSDYASPAFLFPKPNGKFRMVVDYRKLNQKVKFDYFPMPTIENAFQHFNGATVFSVLDLNSAYYQIPLSPKSRRYTAFTAPFGLYEFNKLPMGISVRSQVLSREIDRLFGDLKLKCVFNYADGHLVYSRSIKEHVTDLRKVFGRLQRAGFTLNKDKITLGASKVKFLGHVVSARGINTDPDYVRAVQEFPCPHNLKQLRRFIGMVGFYSKFIPDFSRLVDPLNQLKKKEC